MIGARRPVLSASFVLILAVTTAPRASECAEAIQGLEAWYRLESLHRKIRDTEIVHDWRDSSDNGHHLIDDRNGLPAVFRTLQLNERPVLEIGKANSHSVEGVLELDDHTIVLVCAATRASALFQSRNKGEDGFGLVLREDGALDHLQSGSVRAAYNRGAPSSGAFAITVLGRDAGRLRSFINGADVSSNVEFDRRIRVGRFFRLSRSRAVKLDAEGLRVAEMIIFNRFLSEEERTGLTRCLSEEYAIPLADPVPGPVFAERPSLVLSTTVDRVLPGEEIAPIPWGVSHRVEQPFRHEVQTDAARIHCTRDGTWVRAELTLPLDPPEQASTLRILLLKNNEEYLPEEGRPDPAAGAIRLEAEFLLDAGDIIEVIAVGKDPAETVRLTSAEAELKLRTADRSSD